MLLWLLAGLTGWESLWWARRRSARTSAYNTALARARALGRSLVVVGAPDAGPTAGYPCGDVTIDLNASSCPNFLRADITKPLPFADASVVVFASCVLEYVSDYAGALAELQRISGGELYVTRVEPWTLTAYLYPGALRVVPGTIPMAVVN